MDPMTQLIAAKNGLITPAMKQIAQKEYLTEAEVLKQVALGHAVIPANIRHTTLSPIAIGSAFTTKINANIGNSSLSSCPQEELKKLQAALKYGADTVMDLSTGSNIVQIRQTIIEHSTAPIGTVPIYEIIARCDGDIEKMTSEMIMKVIQIQAEQGVDYFTIHFGLLKELLPLAFKRKLKIVSRGGSLIAKWMLSKNKENPFYTLFDDILDVCKTYDITLSLGDGLRPGCLADASDEAQFAEMKILGELVQRSREAGVQAMVEGPGHIPLDQIQMNMELQQKYCDNAPFYILGPVVTDCAPGYDHITSAIGATLGAFYGAAMLCYVTPKEHLGLPNEEDVRNGVIAYKIAAHAADIARKRPHARDRDDAISEARAKFDWNAQFALALDPEKAKRLREEALMEQKIKNHDMDTDHCTMCGPNFCSMRISNEVAKQFNKQTQ